MLVRVASFVLCCAVVATAHSAELPDNYAAHAFRVLNDNGAWSWFMDERAIVDRGKLLVGSVRALGELRKDGGRGERDPHGGDIQLDVLDLASGEVEHVVLHPNLEPDDHDGPALLVRPDGRYLAVYTRHGADRTIRTRVSEPGNPLAWGPVVDFETPGETVRFGGDSVTYSNLFRLPDGRTYDFHRGVDHDPNYLVSDDDGSTWRYGGRVLHGRDGYSPYLKYAYDGAGTLHFVVTEDHPRNFDNSLYHGFLRGGKLHRSDGAEVGPLSQSREVAINAWDFTKIFPGDPDRVAWMCDVELDADGRPYTAFSVQRDGRGLPRKEGGFDHRYHYARFDGREWRQYEAAYAGHRLYPGEDDYTGLAALDPRDPNVMYVSTSADPATGVPLKSRADGRRHYELYRGVTSDRGATWSWTPLTANSTVDNLRPIVPKGSDGRTVLVWMRGRYFSNNREWTTKVVAATLE